MTLPISAFVKEAFNKFDTKTFNVVVLFLLTWKLLWTALF